MSIIKKTPYIESKIKAYSETTLTNLLLELNTSTPTLDADWGNLPESLVATCLFKFSDGYKTGILVRENLKTTIFLAYDTAEQTIAIYELDLEKEIKKEIREYLTISELRRVIYETKDTASAGEPFKIVEITGLSGTLSDDDYVSVSGDNCVIKVGTQFYYKAFDASTLIVYQAFSRQAGQNSALYEYIEITKSTKGFELIAENIVEANPTDSATATMTKEKVGATVYDFQAVGVDVLTTAPESANTSGLKFVVLSEEPATKYDGYLYIITESVE